MGKQEVESIYVRFRGDTKSYDAAVKRVNASLTGMSKRMQRFGKNMTKYVTVPLAAMGAVAVNEFAKVDNAMQKSVAIMGSSLKDFGGDIDAMKSQMQDLAIATSLETSTSADKLAESYYFLASAGFDAKQSMAALDDVNRFAVAGMFDMARATDLLTDAQSALGLNSGTTEERMASMARVSDVLVRANTLANASVEQFSVALTSKAGTSMKVFNQTVEEGVAVLSVYADQGIKAELAGTSYDRVLRLLSKSALDNAKAHKAFGLEVFDSEGKMNSMVDIVKQLEVGFKGMSMEEKVATLATLGFEARVQQAIFPLIGASEQMANYKKELEAATGFTADVAEKQMQSFGNQMLVTANHVKAVARQIGQILAPRIIAFGKIIQEQSIKFLALNEDTQKLIVKIATFAAILPPVITAVGMGVPIVLSLASSFAKLGIAVNIAGQALVKFGKTVIMALAPVIAPILLVIAKITLVGVAIAGLWAYMNGAGSITEAWTMIKEAVSKVADKVMGFFENWKANWPMLQEMMQNFIDNLGTNVGIIFDNMMTNVKAFAMAAVEILGILFGWISEQGLPMAADFVTGMIEGIMDGYNWLVGKMTDFFVMIMEAMVPLTDAILEIWGELFETISGLMQKAAIAMIKMMVAISKLDLKGAIKIGIDFAGEVAKDATDAAIQAAAKGAAAINKAFKPIANTFDAGVQEGKTTDDLFGSINNVLDGAGFVNPLAGTTVMDAPDFHTSRANTPFDHGEQSMDPFAENLMMGDWAIPLDIDPTEAENTITKIEQEPIMLSMGVDAKSVSSTATQLTAFNRQMQAMQSRQMKKEADQEAKKKAKADLKESNVERAKERQEKKEAENRLFGFLENITSFLDTDSDGNLITPANLGGSGA